MHITSSESMNHSLVVALIKEGMDGNVKAITELIDRTEGKAPASIDFTTKGEKIQQHVFQVIDEKTAAMCESIVAGVGRESQGQQAAPVEK